MDQIKFSSTVMMSQRFRSLVDVVRFQAAVRPTHTALVFLPDGEVEGGRLTYAELDRRARVFAARLQAQGMQGHAVLLMLPSSIEYVVAFLGSLYAAAVPVPVYPPTSSMHAERVAQIVKDCDARGVILSATSSAEKVKSRLGKFFPDSFGCAFLPIDEMGMADEGGWIAPTLIKDDLAFLQYTSGSTSQPRGVMVTHGNLLANCQSWQTAFQQDHMDVFVTWLPLFHDMGLIGNIIQPLFVGATIVLMPPMAFLQKPMCWLTAISRYRGTTAFAPNFAYELCAATLDEPLRKTLDLSSWRIAANGAEPVHANTLDRFSRRFSDRGFRAEAMQPCYGLAEATLAVSLGVKHEMPHICEVDADALKYNKFIPVRDGLMQSRALVSCGRAWADVKIAIVEPDSCRPCAEGEVGEIWVQGPSIANGYWRRAEETELTFRACLDSGAGPFLRTGDLGALHCGELYVTGRIKDLIIIRGQNHYPQDIEQTVSRAHPALCVGHGAAFSITVAQEERLVVVQEIKRSQRKKFDGAEIVQAVRTMIFEQHGLAVHAVALLNPASVHITSSGKIQRKACKQDYLFQRFEVLYAWQEGQRLTRAADTLPAAVPSKAGERYPDIESWLVQEIAQRQGLARQEILLDMPFSSLGFDSAGLIALSGALSVWLGCAVEPVLLYDYPSIERLAARLAGGVWPANEISYAAKGDEVVAVVGMACRFPGADNIAAYWQLLAEGRDAIREVPAARWPVAQFYQAGDVVPGKMNTRWGGFLEGVDEFDAAFFGVSPREAQSMDPQQRLLLQTVWHALEDAGIPPHTLAGSRSGVFVGISSDDYRQLQLASHVGIDAYSGTGNAASIAANRISYALDLRGPSMVVDTACSSSLVALHQARLSLQAGECDLAIVAGVNLILAPETTLVFSQANMMAADGRCKAFDAHADGYVRSEGCGVVILKRLAPRDDTRIQALIVGSAVNQDGRSNGLTAPNGLAQQAVMRQALASARLPASRVGYIEAHGTGTRLGDPIEVSALKAVYGEASASDATLCIGAVKSNIGHLEPAAGVAGLIKVVLALQHGKIPANLHLHEVNPAISLAGTRCVLPTTPQDWLSTGGARVAGVSAFSFGGTNAHLIVQQAPAAAAPVGVAAAADSTGDLLLLSAKTPVALRELAAGYANLLADTSISLPGICCASSLQRSHHALRLALPCTTRAEAAALLQRYSQGALPDELLHGTVCAPGKVAFLFTGQGAQYARMGWGFYQGHAGFRQIIDRCADLLTTQLPRPLLDVLFSEEGAELTHTEYAQPALFALEYALASVWLSCGIQPDYLIGHSLGEYVAACLAGVFSLEDGLKLVTQRGRLMQHATAPGAMLAVRADTAQISSFLQSPDIFNTDSVALAAHNSPQEIVLSGEQAALQALLPLFAEWHAATTWLPVSRAFHSPLMHSMLGAFEQVARQISYQRPFMPVISNLSGQLAGEEMASADYWVRHVSQPVLFGKGLETLAAAGCRFYVEVGPQPVLTSFGKQIITDALWLPSLRRGHEDMPHWQRSIGLWHVAGGRVDWRRYWQGRSGGELPPQAILPLYPFQRERYWFASGAAASGAAANKTHQHPLLGEMLDVAGISGSHFRNTLMPQQPAFIAQHRVFGAAVLPGAAIIEWALAALAQTSGEAASAWVLRNIEFRRAMTIGEQAGMAVQLALETDGTTRRIRCYGRDAQADKPDWQEHASLEAEPATNRHSVARVAVDALRNMLMPQAVTGCYTQWRERGLDYGPAFQGLRNLWCGTEQALAYIEVTDNAQGVFTQGVYTLNPVALDACLHTLIAFSGELPRREVLLPVRLAQFRSFHPLPARIWCHAVWHGEQAPGRYAASLTLCDDSGEVLAVLDDLQLVGVSRDMLGMPEPEAALDCYATAWLPMAGDAPPAPPGRWLIYCPDLAQARALLAESAAQDYRTLIVTAAPGLQRLEPGLIGVQVQSEGDIASLFASLLNEHTPLQGLLLVDGDGAGDGLIETTYLVAQRSFLFIKAFLAAYADALPDIIVCARGAGDTGSLAGLAVSTLSGLTKSIIAEYPQLKCVQLDIESDLQSVGLAQVLAMAARLPGAGHIAQRGGRWFRAELQRLAPPAAPQHNIRADASYLISGGLGGLGMAVAEWLVENGARSLVLIGRSLPAAGSALLQSLHERGVHVRVLQADIGDAQAWQTVAAQLENCQPPVRGIIHAAGVLDDGVIGQLDWARLQKVLAPKVGGAWHLHRYSENLGLDFFVLFSSITSLIGSAGQCNYVMANAFLDSLAHYRSRLGLPASCINWGPWSEVGMAAQPQTMARLTGIGMQGLDSRHALQALASALQASAPQIGVASIDWPRYLAAMPRRHPYLLLASVAAAPHNAVPAAQPAVRSDLMGVSTLDSPEAIADYLLEKVARVLRLDTQRQAGLRSDFTQLHLNRLGLDSLMAIELRNRVLADLAVDVPIHYLIGTYVVGEVVALIDAQLAVQRVLQAEDEAGADEAEREVFVL